MFWGENKCPLLARHSYDAWADITGSSIQKLFIPYLLTGDLFKLWFNHPNNCLQIMEIAGWQDKNAI